MFLQVSRVLRKFMGEEKLFYSPPGKNPLEVFFKVYCYFVVSSSLLNMNPNVPITEAEHPVNIDLPALNVQRL